MYKNIVIALLEHLLDLHDEFLKHPPNNLFENIFINRAGNLILIYEPLPEDQFKQFFENFATLYYYLKIGDIQKLDPKKLYNDNKLDMFDIVFLNDLLIYEKSDQLQYLSLESLIFRLKMSIYNF